MHSHWYMWLHDQLNILKISAKWSLAWQHEFTLHSCAVLPRVSLSSVSTYIMYKLLIYRFPFTWCYSVFEAMWFPWSGTVSLIGRLHYFNMWSINGISGFIFNLLHVIKYWTEQMIIPDLLNRPGISLFFVWPGPPLSLILSGGPKWPENSCVCPDPQLLLCPDIFISVAYLWQQCMRKGPSGPKQQTDYMTSRLLGLLTSFNIKYLLQF